jgi:ribosome-associated protein
LVLDPQAVAGIAVEAAEEKKAYDITVLNIGSVSVVADYFVILNGRSSTHTQSIAEEIEDKLEAEGVRPYRKEGFREGRWILLDYGDVVIHVFQESERRFYNLERLWGDAQVVGMPMNG